MSDRLSSLNTDLAADILTKLPIPSLLRAAAVSKHLRSVITSPTFPTHPNHLSLPWFFLHGLHNTNPKLNQSFAFDPSSSLWLRLPPPSPSSSDFLGSSGFLFSTAPSFSFSPVLKPLWKFTSPLTFSRINPLLGVFTCSGCAAPRFVVVGGVRFIGGLVDIEDRLAVEIYDPVSDSWEICSPLPPDFPSGNSCQTLSSALFGGRFYVFGIFSFFVSWFDLRARVWSRVATVRPPGLVFGFLVSSNEMLVLAGMCNGANGPSFNLWRVDCESLELREMGAMPRELLYGLVDVEEEDKFASLKCVGTGGLVYVFNEEYHKKYPACVCEIDGTSGECRWRRVPPLPSPVNKFHKVVSFCSTVLPRDVFVGQEGEGGVVRGVED